MKKRCIFALMVLVGLAKPLFSAQGSLNSLELSYFPHEKPKKTLVLTLPKSGTHLIHATIAMITGKPVEQIGYDRIDFDHIDFESKKIDIYHLWEEFSYLQETILSNANVIIMIRDPRDIAVSFPFHLEKLNYDFAHSTSPKDFRRQLRKHRKLLNEALTWMQDPKVLVCRFEELVGPQGGGERNDQMDTIRRLANHLGYALTEARIAYIADHIFGPNEVIRKGTFRSGQIGSWKTTPWLLNEKEIVKQLLGPALIEMGYEQDNNW